MTTRMWVQPNGKVLYEDVDEGVVPEDAQGVDWTEDSAERRAGIYVQESGVSEASQAERIQRKFANKDSYAALGFSDQEAQAAAGLDRAQGPEASYALLGLSREEAKAAAEIKAGER